MSARVALSGGPDRFGNVAAALDLVADQIDLSGCRRLLIKPNFVSPDHPLACTNAEAVRAVLEFVRARYQGPITLAEGSALAGSLECFRRLGYLPLAERYGADLLDLNAGPALPVQVYDRQLCPRVLRLARAVVESDFRISVGPPKTHDTVIVTLSLKNMIMGALVHRAVAGGRPPSRLALLLSRAAARLGLPPARLGLPERSDKQAMHQGFPAMNLNLARIAPLVRPHLAVIDGFEAMEGAGPLAGDRVDWRIALAGTDALAVDSLTADLMGFPPDTVGYLAYCRQMGLGVGDPSRITVLGGLDPQSVRRQFRPHPTFGQQRQWHLDDPARLLGPPALCAEPR